MNNVDLSYAAGFFDGEGHISLRRCKVYNKDKHILQLQCGVCQSNEDVIKWFKDNFGGNFYGRKRQAAYKMIWDWDVYCNQAKDFLKLVLPHLKVKKKEAEIAIYFQENKNHSNNPEKATTVEFEDEILRRLGEVRCQIR